MVDFLLSRSFGSSSPEILAAFQAASVGLLPPQVIGLRPHLGLRSPDPLGRL